MPDKAYLGQEKTLMDFITMNKQNSKNIGVEETKNISTVWQPVLALACCHRQQKPPKGGLIQALT